MLVVTRGLREKRPNAVRSTGRSLALSILLVLATATLQWLTENNVVAVAAAAFLTMPLGYRWFGFVGPNRDS